MTRPIIRSHNRQQVQFASIKNIGHMLVSWREYMSNNLNKIDRKIIKEYFSYKNMIEKFLYNNFSELFYKISNNLFLK